jgi:hypothetical protein
MILFAIEHTFRLRSFWKGPHNCPTDSALEAKSSKYPAKVIVKVKVIAIYKIKIKTERSIYPYLK